MITKDNCIRKIVDKYPAFQPTLKDHRDYWATSTLLYLELAEFARYLSQEKVSDIELKNALSLVEHMIGTADDYVRAAMCTGFLEALVGCIDRGEIDSKRVLPLLGPKSLTYIREWDGFCGLLPASVEKKP